MKRNYQSVIEREFFPEHTEQDLMFDYRLNLLKNTVTSMMPNKKSFLERLVKSYSEDKENALVHEDRGKERIYVPGLMEMLSSYCAGNHTEKGYRAKECLKSLKRYLKRTEEESPKLITSIEQMKYEKEQGRVLNEREVVLSLKEIAEHFKQSKDMLIVYMAPSQGQKIRKYESPRIDEISLLPNQYVSIEEFKNFVKTTKPDNKVRVRLTDFYREYFGIEVDLAKETAKRPKKEGKTKVSPGKEKKNPEKEGSLLEKKVHGALNELKTIFRSQEEKYGSMLREKQKEAAKINRRLKAALAAMNSQEEAYREMLREGEKENYELKETLEEVLAAMKDIGARNDKLEKIFESQEEEYKGMLGEKQEELDELRRAMKNQELPELRVDEEMKTWEDWFSFMECDSEEIKIFKEIRNICPVDASDDGASYISGYKIVRAAIKLGETDLARKLSSILKLGGF